jgi:UPF0716 family protein affecting phage T7 exclusion
LQEETVAPGAAALDRVPLQFDNAATYMANMHSERADMRHIAYTSTNPPSLLQKTLAIIVTAALVALGLMFSAVLFAAILIVVVIGWAWMWWKTREVRRQMKQMHEQMRDFQERSANMQQESFESGVFRGETFEGEIIEGEVIREERPHKDKH